MRDSECERENGRNGGRGRERVLYRDIEREGEGRERGIGERERER